MSSEGPANHSAVAEYFEDAVAATTADLSPLTDEELQRGGLVRVPAFVRTRQSTAALRTARLRRRQAASGRRQVNLVAPDTPEARAALKDVADTLAAGLLTPVELAKLIDMRRKDGAEPIAPGTVPGSNGAVPVPRPTPTQEPFAEDVDRVRRILQRGGWRAKLIRWIASSIGTRRSEQGA